MSQMEIEQKLMRLEALANGLADEIRRTRRLLAGGVSTQPNNKPKKNEELVTTRLARRTARLIAK